MGHLVYSRSEYYDIAFSWDIAKEADSYGGCSHRYGEGPAKRLLELGCGAGRFPFEFAKRLPSLGLGHQPTHGGVRRGEGFEAESPVRVTLGDMAEFRTDEEHDDGALILFHRSL